MAQPDPESRPPFEEILETHTAFARRLEEVRRHIEERLHERDAEIARLTQALEQQRASLDGAQSNLERLQGINRRQASDLEALQNAQLQWAVDREDLLKRLREGEATRTQAQRDHEEALAQRIQERDTAAAQAKKLQGELSAAQSTEQASREALTHLQDQQSTWTRERKAVVAEVGRLEQQALELSASLKQTQAEHQALKEEHAQLQRDLEAFERREAQRHEQIQQLEKERTTLERVLSDAHTEAAALKERVKEAEEAARAIEAKLELKRKEQEQWSEAQGKLLAEMMAKEEEAQTREKTLLGEKKQLAIDLERTQTQLSELATSQKEGLRRKEAEWGELEVAFRREKEGLRGQLDDVKKALEVARQRQQQDTSAIRKGWEKEREALTRDVETLRAELAQRPARGQEGSLDALKDFEAKFRVIYDQSHDLNAPLNAIIGFSDVLLDDKSGAVTPEQRSEFLQYINDGGKTLLDRIRELIDFAKEEAGIGEARRTPAEPVTPPAPWPSSPKAPVILVADNDPTVKERIEPFLTQAGYELVYATTAQEALRLTAQLQPLAVLIDTQLPPKGGSALLYDLKRETKTRDVPLVLTSKVNKEQLGFDIGNCDFLVKPIDRQQLLQMMVKFDLMADGKRSKLPGKLLLVDDDPQNIKLMKAMLAPYGFSILAARGGSEGIKLAQAEKPDMLILDLMMPEIDGFEVVQALKKNPETASIPILIYTAKNITQEDRARLQGNIESIIQKGEFGKERFLELINGLQAAQAT